MLCQRVATRAARACGRKRWPLPPGLCRASSTSGHPSPQAVQGSPGPEIEEIRYLLRDAARERAALREQIQTLTEDVHNLVQCLQNERVLHRERVQRKEAQGMGAQSREAFRPTIEVAAKQPAHVCELGHVSLAELAMQGNHSAQRERLLREIMCVDGIGWEEAHRALSKLDVEKERFYWLESAPYRIGITIAVGAGLAGVLMVFCKPVAEFYGKQIVGEDLPDGVEDISQMTVNQVGTWTWSWMEPMIGTASFLLLCCQFTRSQVVKINMKPYGEYMLQWRADRVANRFPQYDRSMVRAWAKHMPRVGVTFIPKYERNWGVKGPTSGL